MYIRFDFITNPFTMSQTQRVSIECPTEEEAEILRKHLSMCKLVKNVKVSEEQPRETYMAELSRNFTVSYSTSYLTTSALLQTFILGLQAALKVGELRKSKKSCK